MTTMCTGPPAFYVCASSKLQQIAAIYIRGMAAFPPIPLFFMFCFYSVYNTLSPPPPPCFHLSANLYPPPYTLPCRSVCYPTSLQLKTTLAAGIFMTMKYLRTCLLVFLGLTLISQSVIAFDPLSKTNVVNYWGQDSLSTLFRDKSEGSLAQYCEDDTIDVLVIGFVLQINNGVPVLNLAGHCSDTFDGTDILDCPGVADDIKTCQDKGKAIILSIGGSDGSYTLSSANAGRAFADQIWNMFLGGSSKTRPFGDAILDGVDLDLEKGGQEMGYAMFVNELRGKFQKDNSRSYYVTAAPQCPYPDEFTSYALDHAWFDLVWVQFYNNDCGVNTFGTSDFNFDTWNKWATHTAKNKDVRILLGVPGGPGAAGEGTVGATRLNQVLKAVSSYSSFGGVMMWDAGIARHSGLAASAAKFLHNNDALKQPEASPSPSPSPLPSPSPPPSPSPSRPPAPHTKTTAAHHHSHIPVSPSPLPSPSPSPINVPCWNLFCDTPQNSEPSPSPAVSPPSSPASSPSPLHSPSPSPLPSRSKPPSPPPSSSPSPSRSKPPSPPPSSSPSPSRSKPPSPPPSSSPSPSRSKSPSPPPSSSPSSSPSPFPSSSPSPSPIAVPCYDVSCTPDLEVDPLPVPSSSIGAIRFASTPTPKPTPS